MSDNRVAKNGNGSSGGKLVMIQAVSFEQLACDSITSSSGCIVLKETLAYSCVLVRVVLGSAT